MKLRKILGSVGRRPKVKASQAKDLSLFQPEWYLANNPDVAAAGMDPLEHYLKFGEAEDRWPNPYFDPKYYRAHAPGAKKYAGSALEHYEVIGWTRERNPSAKFSNRLYLQQYPSVAKKGIDPLGYHLKTGRFKGNIAFQTSLEKDDDDDLIATMRLINESGLFDGDWYKKYYTDLWYADVDPLFHYVNHGWKEHRNPNVFFDSGWYKANYAADIRKDQDPLLFYIKEGSDLGHDPSPNFSCEAYILDNPDLDYEGIEPLSHYINKGIAEGRRKPESKTSSSGSNLDSGSKLPVPDNLRSLLEYEAVDLKPESTDFDPNKLVIHWVIPDFAAGGGGHMTIFRMVHFLELAGHKQTIWINHPSQHTTPEAAIQTIENHFQHFCGDVRFVDDMLDQAEGDIIIATDCWTVFPILTCKKFLRRFYFVQDHEPSFHPMGANYLVADQTYYEDLDCICASPWLSKLMTEKYGRWARHFWLAADKKIYTSPDKRKKNKIPRIAVYARHFTARRAVELALLALEELADRGVKFSVDFFGAPVDFDTAPFGFVDHGVASQNKLGHIFQDADIGLVFSATNYSLVPQEMMASGLPIVELDGESTRAIFPEDVVTLAAPHPVKIANALDHILKNPKIRAAQANAALKWVSDFSWPGSAKMVEEAMLQRLNEFGTAVSEPKPATVTTPKVSIVIPTLNAGPIFAKVLDAAVNQTAPWPFDILVIDSGSTDQTLEIIAKYPSVHLHEIDKKEFNHGATRNLGAQLTSGEFIAFLTHDALPYNDRWLYNLVTSIERFPNAAGAFGKHLPYPDASPFTKRDLNAHFDMFSKLPLSIGKKTHKKRWKRRDPQWMQPLHFYSDNNSCMKRSVFKEIPYREVQFGEDQLWAYDVIEAGYEKVYAPQALVFHSHDFDVEETFERCKTESAFFKHFFGYELMSDEKALKDTIAASNHGDTDWALHNGVSKKEVTIRRRLNAARLKGFLAGCRVDTKDMF